MAIDSTNKLQISFKKLFGKAHTQVNFAITEESISSNIQVAYTTVFGEQIQPNPESTGGLVTTGDTDNIVEKVRFEIDIIPDTVIGTNQSQGYQLKLPAGYSGPLSSKYSGGTYLHTALGKLQIVPSLYGELKGDGSTEYDPVLYQTDGSTVISKFDGINWNLDTYNGILFVQDPPAGFDISADRPGFLEAFLYVGDYLNDVITGGTGPAPSGNTSVRNIYVSTSATEFISAGITNGLFMASGTTTFVLPASPFDGTEYIFTDGLGSGLTTPITIDGNGNNIIDDTFALINTDYGSITMVYNGFFWAITGSVA